MPPYASEMRRLAELDERALNYRFDLESAPCWSRIDEPGLHAPPTLLEDFGVDVSRLGSYAGTFDWIYGATVCRTFVALEEYIIAFVRAEQALLPASKSLEALVQEEEKHILLFRRYEDLLLARRDRGLFERAYEPTRERMAKRHGPSVLGIQDDGARLYLLWVNALFFEEFTVYLDHRLQLDKARVQPLWLSIHRLHRIEEMQHLATDDAYLNALEIPEEQKRQLSVGFTLGILQHFDDTVGLSPALSCAREAGLDHVRAKRLVSERPFVRDVLHHPAFKRTRAAVPYLRELASPQ